MALLKKSNGWAKMTAFLVLSLSLVPIAAQAQSLLKVPVPISGKGTLPPPPKAAQPLPKIQNSGEEPEEIDTPDEADPAGAEDIDEEGKKKLSL